MSFRETRHATLAELDLAVDRYSQRLTFDVVHPAGLVHWLRAVVEALRLHGDPTVSQVGAVAWDEQLPPDRISPPFRSAGVASPHKWIAAMHGAWIAALLREGCSIAQVADALNMPVSTSPFQVLARLERRQSEPYPDMKSLTAAMRDGMNGWSRYVVPLLPTPGSEKVRRSLAPTVRSRDALVSRESEIQP